MNLYFQATKSLALPSWFLKVPIEVGNYSEDGVLQTQNLKMIERQQTCGDLLSFFDWLLFLITTLTKNCYGMNSFNLLKKKATAGCVAFHSRHIMAYLLLLLINK